MFSLLIAAAVSILVVVALLAAQIHTGTTVFFGIVALLAAYYLVGYLVRRKIKAVQNDLQAILVGGQQRISRKIQQVQGKPGVNIKLLQRQIESDQKNIFREALEYTKRFEPLKRWNLLMGRQIATMRLQFLYQLKEFEQVDELLASRGLFKGPLLMEPMSVAMKMARQYKNGDMAGVEKTFKRHVKWFRGSRGTLLYALMSWIQVKQGETEKARLLLQDAKESTGDETLTYNWERLCNNKPKSFSNAGLGDEWYGLYLENPPAPKQQRVRGNQFKGRGF